MRALYIFALSIILGSAIWFGYLFCYWYLACEICEGRKITWKLFKIMYSIAPEKWNIHPRYHHLGADIPSYINEEDAQRFCVAYGEVAESSGHLFVTNPELVRFSFFDTIRFYFWAKARQAEEDKAEQIVMDAKTKEDLAKLYLSFQKDIDCYIKKHHAEVV